MDNNDFHSKFLEIFDDLVLTRFQNEAICWGGDEIEQVVMTGHLPGEQAKSCFDIRFDYSDDGKLEIFDTDAHGTDGYRLEPDFFIALLKNLKTEQMRTIVLDEDK
jgi:hypothetical protein